MSTTLNRRFLDVSLIVLGTVNEPPSTVENGMQYIVGDEPSGVFEGAAVGSIARYDGYKQAWTFTKPAIGKFEILDTEAKAIKAWNGESWATRMDLSAMEGNAIKPVLMILKTGYSLPATATKGEFFLNFSNGGFYTAIEENTWDDGLPVAVGTRYASSTDRRIYERSDRGIEIEEIPDGAVFLNRADDCIYTHDAVYQVLVKVGGDGNNGAVETTMTETYALTAPDLRIKSFMLSKPIMEGKEAGVVIFFGGLAMISGVDFEATAQVISWADKGLDRVGLEEGDVLTISYPTADSGVLGG